MANLIPIILREVSIWRGILFELLMYGKEQYEDGRMRRNSNRFPGLSGIVNGVPVLAVSCGFMLKDAIGIVPAVGAASAYPVKSRNASGMRLITYYDSNFLASFTHSLIM